MFFAAIVGSACANPSTTGRTHASNVVAGESAALRTNTTCCPSRVQAGNASSTTPVTSGRGSDSLNESEPRPLVTGVVDEAFPAWTRDGQQVVFVRSAADSPATTFDAWVLPVVDGFAQAEPTIAAKNIGASPHVAVTDDAMLYVVVSLRSNEIFTRSVDLTGDAAPGNPSRIAKGPFGGHVSPSWSPDGRSMAYFTTRQRPSVGTTPLRTLTILDLQSGRTHTVPPLGFQGGYTPHWFPDSRSVVVFGGPEIERPERGYYRIDVTTGQASQLVVFPVRFQI